VPSAPASPKKESILTSITGTKKEPIIPDFLIKSWHMLHEIIDADGNGTIERSELTAYLQELGMIRKQSDLDGFWKAADTNNDGVLHRDEFVSIMKSHYHKHGDKTRDTHSKQWWRVNFELEDDHELGWTSYVQDVDKLAVARHLSLRRRPARVHLPVRFLRFRSRSSEAVLVKLNVSMQRLHLF
jgi:hypothetical protein